MTAELNATAGGFTPEQEAAIRRAQKALNLAQQSNVPGEVAAATAAFSRVIERYNLDQATIEAAAGKVEGKREEMKVRGGFYKWQRELWNAVAELNFCFYFTERKLIDDPGKTWGRYGRRLIRQHRLVGRTVNVAAARTLIDYLSQAIERMLRDAYPHATFRNDEWSNAYRQGMTDTLLFRIAAEFKRRLSEERARNVPKADGRPAFALTLLDVAQREKAANYDHLHGEGEWAKREARRAERAKERAEEEAAYAVWAAAHPEEARKKEEEAARYWRNRGAGSRGGLTDAERRRDRLEGSGAYWQGRDAGEKVSLHRQAGETKVAGRIGHG